LLNFNTYPQSMFTMFQITVLGSWSMVSLHLAGDPLLPV
jgi:hypothetical protein